MSRKFITLVTAASLAIASLSASQAQATDKRTRNIILGATALAILGAAISADSRDRQGANTSTYTPRPLPHHGYWHGYNDHPRGPAPGVTPRPVPGRVILGELPKRCLRYIETRRGIKRVYERTCLQRHYKYVTRLPQTCNKKFWDGAKKISGYARRCLIDRSHTTWLNRR